MLIVKLQSERCRKEVNYMASSLPFDDANQDDGNSSDDNAARKESSADLFEVGCSAAIPSKVSISEHIDQKLPVHCFEKDEGFCMDKAKKDIGSGQLSSNPTVDFVSDTRLSKEYFTMGGGFCLDENDTDIDLQGSTNCPVKGATFDSDSPNCLDLGEGESVMTPTSTMNLVEEAEKVGKVDASCACQIPDNNMNSNHTEVGILQENVHEDGKDSSRSLRAMPNLRRKRRKT